MDAIYTFKDDLACSTIRYANFESTKLFIINNSNKELVLLDLVTEKERIVFTAEENILGFEIRPNGDIILILRCSHIIVIRPKEDTEYTEVCRSDFDEKRYEFSCSEDGTCVILRNRESLLRFTISDDSIKNTAKW